jgi:hypothetical protein
MDVTESPHRIVVDYFIVLRYTTHAQDFRAGRIPAKRHAKAQLKGYPYRDSLGGYCH